MQDSGLFATVASISISGCSPLHRGSKTEGPVDVARLVCLSECLDFKLVLCCFSPVNADFMQMYLPDWLCLSSTRFFGSQTMKQTNNPQQKAPRRVGKTRSMFVKPLQIFPAHPLTGKHRLANWHKSNNWLEELIKFLRFPKLWGHCYCEVRPAGGPGC